MGRTRKQITIDNFCAYLKGQMAYQGINQSTLGKVLGMEQPTISKKFAKRSFTLDEVVTMIDLFDIDEATIGYLLKVKK